MTGRQYYIGTIVCGCITIACNIAVILIRLSR